MVEIQPIQLEVRPAATVVASIILLPFANQSPMLPVECAFVEPLSGDESDDEPAYAFHVPDSSNRGPTIKANLGGVDMQILIDSGATKNLVDETTWEWLKQNR